MTQDLGVETCPFRPELSLEKLREQLSANPYFLHLPSASRIEFAKGFGAALQQIVPGSAGICFTQVKIDPQFESKKSLGTHLSRSNRAMPLHTDSSYEARPHELIAFEMVRADRAGGETILAPVEDALALLDKETCSTLQRSQFPFGKITRPVLDCDGTRTKIRYYRRQILPGLNPLQRQTKALIQAMDRLDEALATVGDRYRLSLASGDVLILNNQMVLHGRTALPANSQRLMNRFRMHLDV